MNTKSLGNHFMEPRQDRNLSEIRHFQEFKNKRDILDVTDGNRRYKKYSKPGFMKGLIEHQFGRKGRSMSTNHSHGDLPSMAQMFHSDNQFYSKLLSVIVLGMNTSRQRESSITFG